MAEPPASILQGSRDPHIIAETPHRHHPIHQTPLPSSPCATETPTSIIPDSRDPHPHYPDTTQPHLHLSTHRRPPTSISPPLPFNPLADAPHRPHFMPCMGVAAFTAGASSLLLSWRGWELWDHQQDTSSHPPPAPPAARGTAGVLLNPVLHSWLQENDPSKALWPSHLGHQNVVLKWVPSPCVQEASPTQSRGI